VELSLLLKRARHPDSTSAQDRSRLASQHQADDTGLCRTGKFRPLHGSAIALAVRDSCCAMTKGESSLRGQERAPRSRRICSSRHRVTTRSRTSSLPTAVTR
jgi:hypothetical protein